MNGKIYKITNTITGESYIGQTVNSLEERFRHHKQGTRQPKKYMTKLQKAMDLYGKPAFTIELIEDGIKTIDELCENEKYYIKLYGTQNEYNSTSGGETKLKVVKYNNIQLKSLNIINDEICVHSDFNKIVFSRLTKKELDFLYGILLYLCNGFDEVSFDEIMELSNLEFIDKTKSDFLPWINRFKSKIIFIKLLPKYNTLSITPLFKEFDISFEEELLQFKVNDVFKHLFEPNRKQCFSFSFTEMLSFKKKYEKLLFRHLSQWKKVGKLSFDMDEFIRLLDIPKSYSPSKIRQTVVDPTVKKLKEFYPDLKATTLKKGNKAIGYEFTWDSSHFQSIQADELAKKKKKLKVKDVTPENKSVDELQDELQRMWEEKGLER